MNKNIVTFVKIIAVVIAFVLLNLLFMPKYIEENTDGRITSEYYKEKTGIDVIFLGSSTVQAGVSPMTLYREYGITAYDRSNSSQVIPISYAMAADAIKRNKPKLVVLDVGFLYQEDDYVDEGSSRKSLDGLKWSKIKSDCIKDVMDDSENYMDYVLPILRFHSRWNDLKGEDLRYWIYKPSVTYNGQLLQFGTGGEEKQWNPYMLDLNRVATNRTMDYLQKLNDLCAENDVSFMLMKLPFIEGNWNNAIDAQMTEFAVKNGLNYVNYIEDFDTIGFEYDEFTDGQHMNSFGAEKFSKYLGQYLVDNYNLEDRSKDENYKKVFDHKLSEYELAMENAGY